MYLTKNAAEAASPLSPDDTSFPLPPTLSLTIKHDGQKYSYRLLLLLLLLLQHTMSKDCDFHRWRSKSLVYMTAKTCGRTSRGNAHRTYELTMEFRHLGCWRDGIPADLSHKRALPEGRINF